MAISEDSALFLPSTVRNGYIRDFSAPATGEARGGKLPLGIASGQASFSLSAQNPQRYFPRPFVHFHQTFPHPLMRVSRRFHFSAYPAFPLISTASIQLYKGILSLSTLPILERDFSRFLQMMNYEDKWQIIFLLNLSNEHSKIQ